MANEQNLKPVTKRSKSEAREISRKGGINSGKKRREQKTFAELFKSYLMQEIKDEKLKKELEKAGVQGEDLTNKMVLNMAMYRQALKGDTKAFEIIQNSIGEKPKEQIEVNQTISSWFKEDKDEKKPK